MRMMYFLCIKPLACCSLESDGTDVDSNVSCVCEVFCGFDSKDVLTFHSRLCGSILEILRTIQDFICYHDIVESHISPCCFMDILNRLVFVLDAQI